MLRGLKLELSRLTAEKKYGLIHDVVGPVVRVHSLNTDVAIGSLCLIRNRLGQELWAEVVGFEGELTLLMSFRILEGIGPGCAVYGVSMESVLFPDQSWLGRTLDGFCEPLDHLKRPVGGGKPYRLMASPIPAHDRALVGERLDLGVRALNTFTTCCKGQRMGIFAGSGVGKSVLLSQLARFSSADVIVIGMIGERGREVKEFLEKQLGPAGLAKCVVIVATSDEPALMRRRAAYTTLTIAEYFRDQGADVLCLMDSVTRFAMALREIGLATGMPPTTKGYTPNVFSELPQLLERAGPGRDEAQDGSITGLFTVLVEGDDHTEPVSDTVRGILDGHIWLDRKIAERGRFPAIDVLRSISRTMPDCNQPEETSAVLKARRALSTYGDMEELIRLGAYRKGSNPDVDQAIAYAEKLEVFLRQGVDEHTELLASFQELRHIMHEGSEGVL